MYQFIKVPGFWLDKKFYPYTKVTYNEDRNECYIGDEEVNLYTIESAIYDVMTKKFIKNTTVYDRYKIEYQIGEIIYYYHCNDRVSPRKVKRSKLIEIEYRTNDQSIFVKYSLDLAKERFNLSELDCQNSFNGNIILEVFEQRPIYIFENGDRIEYTHEIIGVAEE